MGHHWLDVCPSFPPKIIWHKVILDILRTNHKTFIRVWALKSHLRKLKRHLPISDLPAYLFWFLTVFLCSVFHSDFRKLLLFFPSVSIFGNCVWVSEMNVLFSIICFAFLNVVVMFNLILGWVICTSQPPYWRKLSGFEPLVWIWTHNLPVYSLLFSHWGGRSLKKKRTDPIFTIIIVIWITTDDLLDILVCDLIFYPTWPPCKCI